MKHLNQIQSVIPCVTLLGHGIILKLIPHNQNQDQSQSFRKWLKPKDNKEPISILQEAMAIRQSNFHKIIAIKNINL